MYVLSLQLRAFGYVCFTILYRKLKKNIPTLAIPAAVVHQVPKLKQTQRLWTFSSAFRFGAAIVTTYSDSGLLTKDRPKNLMSKKCYCARAKARTRSFSLLWQLIQTRWSVPDKMCDPSPRHSAQNHLPSLSLYMAAISLSFPSKKASLTITEAGGSVSILPLYSASRTISLI